MRLSRARTKRLAKLWRRHTGSSGPACPRRRAERAETCGVSSVEDWARYGGGLVPPDDGGRTVPIDHRAID